MEEKIIQIWKPKPTDDLALKPCPFCGNEEIVYIQYETVVGPRWKVVCSDCLATIDPGYAQDRYTVSHMWNRRKEETA